MLYPLLALLLSAASDTAAHQHALELYKQQRYAESAAAFQDAIKTEKPGSPDYNESALFIGQSYFMLSQALNAIPWLEKIPELNEANYMLGYAYLQAHAPGKSEAAFARLFGLKPDSAAAHLVAADMMLKKEYELEAVAEAQKALALDPKLPESHFLLGEVATYRGRLDEGIQDFQAELALNPGYAMAWYRLGDAYTRKQSWDAAIPNLQRAVWLNPDYSGPYILLGKCYLKTGNLANAEGILRRGLLLDPNNREANYLLGQTLMAAGKADEAKAVLDKLKQPRPQ
jgi:tetratricopeptide (TPR) repeat protein